MKSFDIDVNSLSLSSLLTRISELYFQALKDDSDRAKDFIQRVNIAFESLNETEKKVINNDFFYEDYPFWWTSIYSKATYYRLRSKSMNDFKEAFINE